MTAFKAARWVGDPRSGSDSGQGGVPDRESGRRQSPVDSVPGAFVSGYPRGVSFGSVIGNRTAQGRDVFRRYWDSAIDVPGPAVDRLAEIAGENSQYFVVGVVERDGGTLYCTVLFFSPEGFLGKHRKLVLTAAESHLGVRGRLYAACLRNPPGEDRSGDLLGELHASSLDLLVSAHTRSPSSVTDTEQG